MFMLNMYPRWFRDPHDQGAFAPVYVAYGEDFQDGVGMLLGAMTWKCNRQHAGVKFYSLLQVFTQSAQVIACHRRIVRCKICKKNYDLDLVRIAKALPKQTAVAKHYLAAF